MSVPVTTVTYDMKGFLEQCLTRYEELVPREVKYTKVSTPFHDDKIARPVADEAESRGELQAIASQRSHESTLCRENGEVRLVESNTRLGQSGN